MFPVALKLTGAGGLVAAVVFASSDAVHAAAIAGGFTVLNTALLFALNWRGRRMESRHDRMERIFTAPRRAVYDRNGRIIGTVLDLDNPWDGTAGIDPPVPPAPPPRRRIQDFPPDLPS